jgi:hypothetical protein
LFVAGCSNEAVSERPDTTGTLRAALSIQLPDGAGPTHDVAKIHYVVVKMGQRCTDTALAEATVDLETEPLPKQFLPDGGGAAHSFSDALVVLAPGTYTVCAMPLTKADKASQFCGVASTQVMIAESVTSEVTMISQCKSPSNGAGDAITAFNNPPIIDQLIVTPSKFITLCDVATLSVKAHDPDGDPVTFVWQLVGTNQIFEKQTISFRSLDPVTSQMKVTVSDPFGASTSLTVPMHVSVCTDAGRD